MNEVLLRVGGLLYGGWKAARVSVGMNRCAGTFDLEVTDLWPGQDVTRKIRPGDECRLDINGTPVVMGYVDAVRLSIDAEQHGVAISGRDKAADLVDCSAVRSPGQWHLQSITKIANDLTDPFHVPVKAMVDVGGPLDSFSLQEGETVFEAIERAAQRCGLLVMSDGAGGVLLTRAGLQRASDDLVMGGNILAARGSFDARDRYREYIVKGQSAGSDYWNGTAAAHAKSVVTDTEVKRYRPLLITGESPGQVGGLARRAKWEQTVRAARSMEVTVVVQGFAQSDGSLWAPNRLVHVVAEPLRLDDDLLISAVEFEQSDGGSTTTLSLTRADAYTLEPVARAPAAAAASAFWDKAGARR